MDKEDLKLSHEDDRLLLALWNCRTGGVSEGAAVRLSGAPYREAFRLQFPRTMDRVSSEKGRRASARSKKFPSCSAGFTSTSDAIFFQAQPFRSRTSTSASENHGSSAGVNSSRTFMKEASLRVAVNTEREMGSGHVRRHGRSWGSPSWVLLSTNFTKLIGCKE